MAATRSFKDHMGEEGDHSMIRDIVSKHGAAMAHAYHEDGDGHTVRTHHPDGHQHISEGHPNFAHAHEHIGIAHGAY